MHTGLVIAFSNSWIKTSQAWYNKLGGTDWSNKLLGYKCVYIYIYICVCVCVLKKIIIIIIIINIRNSTLKSL